MAGFDAGFMPSAPMFSFSSTVSVTVYVQDGGGDPISRLVFAHYANDLSTSLYGVTSDASTGEATFSLNGTPNTEFAFVVQGEIGENCVAHSHKTAS